MQTFMSNISENANKKQQEAGSISQEVSCGNVGHLHIIWLRKTENKFRSKKGELTLGDQLDLSCEEREKFAS